jgi:NADH-quinone oxidoreductase subunit E
VRRAGAIGREVAGCALTWAGAVTSVRTPRRWSEVPSRSRVDGRGRPYDSGPPAQVAGLSIRPWKRRNTPITVRCLGLRLAPFSPAGEKRRCGHPDAGANKQAARIPVLHSLDGSVGEPGRHRCRRAALPVDRARAGRRHVLRCSTGGRRADLGLSRSAVRLGRRKIVRHCEAPRRPRRQTTRRKITLRTVECLASCGSAPMIQVDKTYHENPTVQEVDRSDRLKS